MGRSVLIGACAPYMSPHHNTAFPPPILQFNPVCSFSYIFRAIFILLPFRDQVSRATQRRICWWLDFSSTGLGWSLWTLIIVISSPCSSLKVAAASCNWCFCNNLLFPPLVFLLHRYQLQALQLFPVNSLRVVLVSEQMLMDTDTYIRFSLSSDPVVVQVGV